MKRATIVALAAIAASGTALAQTNSLTLYSGRSKALVEPIIQQFEKTTGIKVNVRYGTDAALLEALEEEGTRSPADLLWANTTGTLVTADTRKLLSKLPASLLKKPVAFAPANGTWVPTSVRFRVVAYNPNKLKAADLPASVMDFPKLTKFKGRIGWTPTYASFQDFVSAMRATQGDAKTSAWLKGMLALQPKSYASNTAMLDAMRAGEIDVALTNHYYIEKVLAGVAEGEHEDEEEEAHEEEAKAANKPIPGAPIAAYYFKAGDVGNLELVTGVAQLKTSKNATNAAKLIDFLLSATAQKAIATSIHEYPVVNGVSLPKSLIPLAEAVKRSPKVAPEKLRDLEGTLKLLRDAGVL